VIVTSANLEPTGQIGLDVKPAVDVGRVASSGHARLFHQHLDGPTDPSTNSAAISFCSAITQDAQRRSVYFLGNPGRQYCGPGPSSCSAKNAQALDRVLAIELT